LSIFQPCRNQLRFLRIFPYVIEMFTKLLKLKTLGSIIFISGKRRDALIIDAVQLSVDRLNIEKRVVGEFNAGPISEIKFAEGHLPGRFSL